VGDELQPWQPTNSALLLARPPWLAVYQDTVRLPGGRILNDFYRVVLPDYAVVVAVTPEQDLVMVRGYKHGLRRVCLCAPAGLLEPGEAPLAAAQRELLEETGYQAPDWECLGRFLTDGNRECGTAHIFLARNAVPVAQANADDDTEVLQVQLLRPEQFLQAIRKEEIALLPTMSAIALALAAGIGRNGESSTGSCS
jgi:ADP-ribose pyrophosphatase